MKYKKLQNYMKQAEVVAENSPDEETQVGSILVKEDSGAVIASGYNGHVRGTFTKLATKRPEKYKVMIHAETNLIYNCARHGISTNSCFIVQTLSPCIDCTRALYQSNIKTVYFKEKYKDFEVNYNMPDIEIDVEQIGEYHKMTMRTK